MERFFRDEAFRGTLHARVPLSVCPGVCFHKPEVRVSKIAKGEFTVSLKPLEFEGVDAAAKLGRMSIDKQITGDLVATTQGQMITAMGEAQGSGVYTAVERVAGSLEGRQGSFALYHVGTMVRGAPGLSVKVVPDSGTDGLTGISGDFKIVIDNGKHLYEFAYSLPGVE